jgi:Na+/melibiose symporter-like transporter
LSFGAISALVGQCLHWAGGDVWPLFVLIPAAALAVLTALLSLPSATPLQIHAKKNDDHSSSSNLLNSDGFLVRIRRLVSNRSVTLLFLIVFLTGCARAVASLFLPAFWSRHLQLSPSEIGLATNSAVVAEVLIFLNGPWFERHLGSKTMLFLAQIAAAIRACAYVWLEDATFSYHFHMVLSIYSIELLKGVAFGLTQLAAVKVVTESAPAGTQATAQALYTCFYAQLPSVLSAFVGARLDTHTLFSGTALLSLLGLFTTAGVFACSK